MSGEQKFAGSVLPQKGTQGRVVWDELSNLYLHAPYEQSDYAGVLNKQRFVKVRDIITFRKWLNITHIFNTDIRTILEWQLPYQYSSGKLVMEVGMS